MRWVLVGLLSAFMAVNFADKAVFGLAATPIIKEYGLSHAQFGAIGSAFFLLFSLSAFGISWLSDRTKPDRLLVGMALLWSAAQLPVAASVGVAGLIGLRVLLGAAEGPALPVALNAAYAEFGERVRPRIAAIVLAGAPLGTALAAVACTWCIKTYGWHTAYAALGVVSLAWIAVWIAFRRSPGAANGSVRPAAGRRSLPLRRLIASRTFAGVAVATFAAYAGSAVGLIWLPSYLEHVYGMSPTAAGWTLAAIWPLQIPAFFAAGWLAENLHKGTDRGTVYTRLGMAALGLCGFAFAGLALAPSTPVAVLLITLALVVVVMTLTVAAPLIAEVVPATSRGTGFGSITAIYSLAGISIPWAFGYAIDLAPGTQAGYRLAFALFGVLLVAGAATAAALIRPIADRARLADAGAQA